MGSMFVALPADIHIALLALVDVLDIISVRQTCKSLHALSNERIVWLHMLQKECAEHHLFFPPRTLHAMTTPELESAACGPSKWLSMASKSTRATCTVAALASRRIPLFDWQSQTRFIGPGQHFQVHSWYLVPGGRFLVTWSSLSLSVWDLAACHNCNFSQPLSTVSVPCWAEASYADVTSMTVQPTAKGEGLTIMIFFHRQDQSPKSLEWFTCHVFDIMMDVGSPTLCRIASLQGPKNKEAYSCVMQGDKLAILMQPRTLAIWDYREDTWASWFVSGTFYSSIYDILIQPTYVAILYYDKIAVWRIPPLTNVDYDSAQFQQSRDSTPLAAPLSRNLPTQPIRRYRWVLPEPWRLDVFSSGSYPIFGTKTHLEENLIHFDSFELLVSKDFSTVSVTERLPPVILDETVSHIQLRAEYSDLACVTIFGRESFRIYPFSGSRVGDGVPVHLAKASTVTISISSIQRIPDFCPASGRIVFMQDNDYAALHVWDLI